MRMKLTQLRALSKGGRERGLFGLCVWPKRRLVLLTSRILINDKRRLSVLLCVATFSIFFFFLHRELSSLFYFIHYVKISPLISDICKGQTLSFVFVFHYSLCECNNNKKRIYYYYFIYLRIKKMSNNKWYKYCYFFGWKLRYALFFWLIKLYRLQFFIWSRPRSFTFLLFFSFLLVNTALRAILSWLN